MAYAMKLTSKKLKLLKKPKRKKVWCRKKLKWSKIM